MTEEQRKYFEKMCDTLRNGIKFEIEEKRRLGASDLKIGELVNHYIKDKEMFIRLMLTSSGFIADSYTIEKLCNIFRPCLMCSDYCDDCYEWVDTYGLEGFTACCFENLIESGMLRRDDKEAEVAEAEDDDTIEADPYKEIETYKKVIKETLDELYEELNYTTYAKLAERLRENGLWK